MGYAPLWGQIALNEDEMTLALHRGRPPLLPHRCPIFKVERYFVIGCTAPFKGRALAMATAVIAATLENAGTLAGIPAEHCGPNWEAVAIQLPRGQL